MFLLTQYLLQYFFARPILIAIFFGQPILIAILQYIAIRYWANIIAIYCNPIYFSQGEVIADELAA